MPKACAYASEGKRSAEMGLGYEVPSWPAITQGDSYFRSSPRHRWSDPPEGRGALHAPQRPERLKALFNELAATWQEDTWTTSSLERMLLHPAYQRIIGLGEPAVPLLLRALRSQPGQWFWALRCITGEDPAEGIPEFDAAVNAWVRWGVENRYLQS